MPASNTTSIRYWLTAEPAERCAPPLLSPEDWQTVAGALGEMRDQLLEDIPDEAGLNEMFGDFVANLIELLADPEIASWDQAGIYARSSNRDHRARAAAWTKQRQH